VLSFPLANRPVLRGYAEFTDLPENRPLLAYSLNEIAAEKIVALTDPARNEPRDLYDLWYLTVNEEVRLDHLLPAICQKLEFREKPCEDLQAALARKEARLRTLWNTRLFYQMAALPPFEQVFSGNASHLPSGELALGLLPPGPSILGPLHVLRSFPPHNRENNNRLRTDPLVLRIVETLLRV